MEKKLHGYMIDSDGFVWNKAHTKPLAYEIDKSGYKRVGLSTPTGKNMYFIHRLVAECFCEKPDGCNIVNHLDCNRLNNNYKNLEWTTSKGNTQHSIQYGAFSTNIENLKTCNCKNTYLYENNQLVYTAKSRTDMGKYLGVSKGVIAYYINTNKLFQNKYLIIG